MTAPKMTVSRRLTQEEAHDAGLIPRGQAWDEEQQTAVPIGMLIEREQLERPLDITAQLSTFQKNRTAILKFVKDYLVEAEYDSRNAPIPGKVGDYYKVPGSEQKALTKRGASKINQLFRWSRGAARQVAATETKEYCSATIEVPLVDQYGRIVGAGVASCNTAESGFQGAAVKKYGGWGEWKDKRFTISRPPDYRAAQNDVVARAAKRASVQATIVASAIEEIFTAAPEEEREGAATVQTSAARLPDSKRLGDHSGRLVTEVATEDLRELAVRMKAKMTDPDTWQPVLETIELELDRRRSPDPEAGF
jgi:hypothetical protein